MRRIVIADALGGGALHFYCGGNSVLIDAYGWGDAKEPALPEAMMQSISAGEGKFKGISAALYTQAHVSRWCRETLGLPAFGANDALTGAQLVVGRFTAQRYSLPGGSDCAWLLGIEGLSILVCGQAVADDILSAVERMPDGVGCVFAPFKSLSSGCVAEALRKKGAQKFFIYNMSHDVSDEEISRLNKWGNKFSKRGFTVRVINSYPSGIIL